MHVAQRRLATRRSQGHPLRNVVFVLALIGVAVAMFVGAQGEVAGFDWSWIGDSIFG